MGVLVRALRGDHLARLGPCAGLAPVAGSWNCSCKAQATQQVNMPKINYMGSGDFFSQQGGSRVLVTASYTLLYLY